MIEYADSPYIVVAPHGGSGHFLTHFLAFNFKRSSITDIWIDKNSETEYDDIHIHRHEILKRDIGKYVIRVVPKSFDEYIKIAYNRYIKCGFNIEPHNFDKIIITILEWGTSKEKGDLTQSYEYMCKNTECDYCLSYSDVHDINKLIKLYEKINGESIPDFKVNYALSYINEHADIYNGFIFQTASRIADFEYTNNLINHIRLWDINDIIELNYNEFLDSALKLENYSDTEFEL